MSRGPSKSFDPEVALRSAMEVFWRDGYEGAALSSLLGAMGIARKSLYDTFGSKRELFVQALALYAREELGAVRALLDRDGSALENVLAVLARWEQAHAKRESRGCLLGNNTAHLAGRDPELAALLRRQFTELEARFAETLERARDEGELDAELDPLDTARLIVSAAQGLALMSRVRGDGALARSVVGALRQQLGVH